MSKHAAILAHIVEYNTGGTQQETMDCNRIRTIAAMHSQFEGDLNAALSGLT